MMNNNCVSVCPNGVLFECFGDIFIVYKICGIVRFSVATIQTVDRAVDNC